MVPKWGLVLAVAVGLSQAIPDALQWLTHPAFNASYVIPLVSITTFWSVAQYLLTLEMIMRAPSVAGFIRFLAVNVILFVPLTISIGSAWVLPPLVGKPVSAVILIAGLFVSVAVLLIFRAWPVAQALCSNLVSPLEVFRATKGHRWSLIWVPGIVGGIDKLVPGYAQARINFGVSVDILIYCAVNAIVLIGLSAVAAAAWALASQIDGRLTGNTP